MTWSRIAGTFTGLLAGAVLAVVVLFLGPNEQVVCGGGHLANQIAQDVARAFGAGHVDGASASFCKVPNTPTWIVATVLAVGGLVAGFRIGRERP